jgi:hypothetical protein
VKKLNGNWVDQQTDRLTDNSKAMFWHKKKTNKKQKKTETFRSFQHHTTIFTMQNLEK